LAIAGIPLDQISRLLGHSDPRITIRVYAKHSPDYLKSAIDALTG
jgi:integrase